MEIIAINSNMLKEKCKGEGETVLVLISRTDSLYTSFSEKK